MVIKNVGRV